jgi:hypothetical protein
MDPTLFQEDVFSVQRPIYAPAKDGDLGAVKATLSAFGISNQSTSIVVEQVGAIEINSNNFRVAVGAERYLVKRSKNQSAGPLLESCCQVAERLRSEGVSFAPIIPFQGQQFVYTDGASHHWIISRYLEANYFHGGSSELLAVVTQIPPLMRRLACVQPAKNNLFGVFPSVDFVNREETLYSKLLSNPARWDEWLPSEIASLLRDHVVLVAHWYELAQRAAKNFKSDVPLLCHNDLHPHNVLVHRDGDGDGLAAFVDIESLQLNFPAVALGFGIFKLLRQHGSYLRKLNPVDFDMIFRGDVDKVFALIDQEWKPNAEHGDIMTRLRNGAAVEIVRRILIILDLNMNQNNRAWNFVFPIHLRALKEMNIIFSGVKS